jgi:tRNA(Ile2) C34 agmatinyltransferase TiaS
LADIVASTLYRKDIYMGDNNLEKVEKSMDEKSEEKKTSCIFLRNLAVDYEEHLYDVINQIKMNEINVLEKEADLKDVQRTKDHNIELFSTIRK